MWLNASAALCRGQHRIGEHCFRAIFKTLPFWRDPDVSESTNAKTASVRSRRLSYYDRSGCGDTQLPNPRALDCEEESLTATATHSTPPSKSEVSITNEAFAIFICSWLMSTPQIPDATQAPPVQRAANAMISFLKRLAAWVKAEAPIGGAGGRGHQSNASARHYDAERRSMATDSQGSATLKPPPPPRRVMIAPRGKILQIDRELRPTAHGS